MLAVEKGVPINSTRRRHWQQEQHPGLEAVSLPCLQQSHIPPSTRYAQGQRDPWEWQRTQGQRNSDGQSYITHRKAEMETEPVEGYAGRSPPEIDDMSAPFFIFSFYRTTKIMPILLHMHGMDSKTHCP